MRKLFHSKLSAIFITFGLLSSAYLNHAWPLGGGLTVHILDVGQGDSILITTPHQKVILIDGGPGAVITERLSTTLSFFEDTIDLLLLTHPNQDHLEGFMEILKRYQVNAIMTPEYNSASPIFQAFVDHARELNIPLYTTSTDRDLELEPDVFLDMIGPLVSFRPSPASDAGRAEESLSQDPNNQSLIAKLIYGNTSLLLTGDMGPEEERALLESDADLTANILKSPHHGSQGSGNPAFLEQVSPSVALISAGKNNKYQHPSLETVLRYDEREISWKSTKREGTITLVSDGKKWFFDQ